MKEIFEVLNTFAEGLPEWLKFLSFWILLFGIAFYKKVSFSDVISFFSKTKAKTEIKKKLFESIINHSLIQSKEKYLRIVNNFSFGSSDVDILFKLLLNNKMNSAITLVEKFINDNKDKDLNRNDLIKMLNNLTIEIIADYEGKFLTEFSEILFENSKTNNVPDETVKCIPFYAKQLHTIVIKGFNNYHNKNIEWIFGFIENLRDTEIFEANEEIVKQYLDSIKFALKLSLFDAEKVFKNFNGNLSSKLDILRKLKLWN
jgi:hypothetical protein